MAIFSSSKSKVEHVAKALPSRDSLYLSRKIFHLVGGLMIYLAYSYVEFATFFALFIIVSSVFVLGDLGRQYSATLNQFLTHIFLPFIREDEVKKLSGISYFLIGVSITVALFDPKISKLSILFAALVDPASSYFGVLYGQSTKIFKNTSLHGLAGGFIVSIIISTIYFTYYDLMTERLIIVSLLASFIAIFTEAVPLKINDNFTIPILSAILLQGVFYIFGG